MKRFLVALAVFIAAGVVVYLSTIGCCHLMFRRGAAAPVSLTQNLGLSAAEKEAIAPLEKEFFARKQASCDVLCAKRAQLIQLLKQPQPDRATVAVLVEEIGQEQTSLEKATAEHVLAVREKLEPAKREKLMALVEERLRIACEVTACGQTAGCSIRRKD